MRELFPIDLDFDQLNEADIRGELIDPMLRALGYRAGTPNNINREPVLRYDFSFLGRKKKTDHRLQGRPDYVLEVGLSGRWLIEVKAPNASLAIDDFEQALSYALHPNIAAALIVLTNGRLFKFYAATAKGIEDCLVTLRYDELAANWIRIDSLVGPEGFRRQVPQVRFDSKLPIAKGYGASLRLGGGIATPREFRATIPLPEEATNSFVEMQTPIPRATCERDIDGRLALTVEFGSSSVSLHELLKAKNLLRIPIRTESEFLSRDADYPTLFSGDFVMSFRAGEQSFNFNTWKMEPSPLDIDTYARIDAVGHLSDTEISGTYSLRMYMTLPALGLEIGAEQVGEFHLPVI